MNKHYYIKKKKKYNILMMINIINEKFIPY